MARSVKVAAVQLRSEPGEVARNLAHAAGLIDRAVGLGAELMVLPELFAQGYRIRPALWEAAEPLDGATTRWLSDTARRHRVLLGGGHAVRDGRDVFNAFTLCAADGTVAGRVLKSNAEASVFKRARGSHVVNTALGAVGIGICADNQFGQLLREYQVAGVGLVLMPHASPAPLHTGGAVSDADLRAVRERMAELPRFYAHALDAPVVFVNQVGPLEAMEGLIGRLMRPAQFGFPGLSRIVDARGETVANLEAEEGVLVAEVELGAGRPHPERRFSRGWLLPGNPIFRHLLVPFDLMVGKTRYALRRRRFAAPRP